jgi:hypothetical protein
MSDLTATIKGITKQLEAIRDERMPYANTATRIGEAMLSLLSLYQNTPYVKKEGEQQLVIGDIYLSWDKENNAVKVSKADGSAANFYAEGGISAFGIGSIQGDGGSGMSFERLDNWADYSIDKATAVLSAFLGNDLNERLKKVEGGALTSVDWSIIQNKPTSMPASDVPAWAKAATKPSYAWNEITGKPSEFNPAAHSHSFASLLNKPTTLQGYGITDAKIANGTIKLGAEAITPLTAHQDIYALTLQKNGAIIGSFNPKSANATLNIIVPTKLSQLTDDVVSGKYLPLNSNAVSATKLKDSRLLWGQNFDGTGNVTGALSSVTNIDNLIHFIGNNVGIGTNSPLYKLDINGNARVTDELLVDSYLNLANNKGLRLRDKEGHNQRALFISNSNVVYLGCNDRPLYTLFVGSELHFNVYNNGWQDALVITPDRNATFSGNVLAQGGVTAYTTSDRRLKTNIKQVDSMRIIRSLGGTWQFDYKDTGEHSIGFIAQSVKDSALKSMVCTNADGYLKLNYLDTRLIALALGAAVQVDDKVERLKKRIRVLEKEVEQLKGGEK